MTNRMTNGTSSSESYGLDWSGANLIRTVRSLWKSSPDAMVLTDATGTVRAANPAYGARHGAAPQHLIGQSLACTFPAAEQGAAMAHYRAVFASREIPDAYPAVSQWRDAPEQVTESHIAFATQPDGQAFMLSTVRVLREPLGAAGNDLSPRNDQIKGDPVGGTSQESLAAGDGAGEGAQTVAELVVDALKTWGIEMVFGLRGDALTG